MRIKKEIHWPEIIRPESLKDFGRLVYRIYDFLDRFRRTIDQRDKKIAQAINAADIQVVSAVPSDPPEYGEPALVLYHSGATYRLYAYVGSGWHYVALT